MFAVWALLGTYNVATHDKTADGTAWLQSVWDSYTKGVACSTAKVKKEVVGKEREQEAKEREEEEPGQRQKE